VPYAVLPPAGGERPDAPVVVAWHMLDTPRSEAAFAAAVPLSGLDAWRVYLGLPHSGARLPAGGLPELQERAMADAVLQVHVPVVAGAVAEFPAAFAAVRERFGIAAGPIGVLGGSVGGAVAQLAVAESGVEVRAAVLVNPVVRLRDTVDGLAARFGVTYPWSPAADAFAERVDFLARADELAGAAVLVVTGGDDDGAAIVRPAAELVTRLRDRGATAEWRTVAGMGHGLADEPGLEPAPQTPHAAEVDRHATAWFATHLPA
jgi:alpha-beta hydrolase superfamily lysophospholipase